MARNPSKAAGALFLPDCHNHSVLLSICPSFSLLACLPICFFDLSLTLSHIHTHTPMYIQGRLGALSQSRRWKGRGSCVHANGAVWVGKWWKRGSFSKLTVPFGILYLLPHERPESFSTPSYSHQAWGRCHIPANINNVSILVWIHLSPHSHCCSIQSTDAQQMSVQNTPTFHTLM